MNLFEIVKYGVGCREAAERYGVEVNHYGMALCPFHNDRHPSLYVADDHYHCLSLIHISEMCIRDRTTTIASLAGNTAM